MTSDENGNDPAEDDHISPVIDRGPDSTRGDGPPPPSAPPTTPPPVSPAPQRAATESRRWFSDLHRSSNDRLVAGVAGGLAESTGVPPLIIRLLFVVSATFLLGLVVYGVAWVVLSPDPDDQSASSIPGRLLILAGVVLAVVLLPFGGVLASAVSRLALPLTLILLGMALIARDTDRTHPGVGPTDRSVSEAPPITVTARNPVAVVDDHDDPVSGADTTPSGPARPPDEEARPDQPRPVRRRPTLRFPYVGLITWSTVLVVIGILAAFAVIGGPSVGPGTGLALALLLFSGGLTVSAFRGRARGLILPILALGGVLGLLAVVDVQVGTFTGSFDERASRSGDLPDPLHSTVGSSTLTLTDLMLERDRTVQLGVDFGTLTVHLPLDTTVIVEGRVGLGAVHTYRYSRAGAVYDPSVEQRWMKDGVPDPGSAVERELLGNGSGSGPQLRSYERTGRVGGDTGFGREVDVVFDRGSTHVLTLQVDVGIGTVELFEPYWADDGWTPVEATQLCTVAGGARGVVEPCGDVAEDLRLPLCINDNGYLVDCTEDRPGTLDSPRTPACRDLNGSEVDCAELGIDATGAELISPIPESSTVTSPAIEGDD